MQGTYDRLNEMLNRELSAVLSQLYPLLVVPRMCLTSLSLTGAGKAGLWAMCMQAATCASILWV